MLVFFSDVHLTDGTSGETINQEAFAHFVDQVADLAEKRHAREVRVVLLGDGFDVIRSSAWLKAGSVRPWSHPSVRQRRRALGILQATCEQNDRALEVLREMPYRIAERSRVPYQNVHLDYVLGNHDWIINRYRATRQVVADALGLPAGYVQRGFPLAYESSADAYDVLARHGDRFDRMNHCRETGRDASSLGDAIVVELLGRFPLEVGKELGDHPARERIVRHLKEIDNIRPYAVIPAWVAEALVRLGRGHPEVLRAARRACARCCDEFWADSEVMELMRRQLSWLERLYMRTVFHQVKRRRVAAVDLLTRLGDRLHKGWRVLTGRPGSRYCTPSLDERRTDGALPRFVLYGHSHKAESVPIGPHPGGGDRFYLNTGTWRSVWEKARTADGSPHFAAWKEMSYIVLYSAAEGHGRHEFEVWTGSLRDRADAKRHRPVGSRPRTKSDAARR